MMNLTAFETPSVRMESMLLLRFQAPEDDVDRIKAAVATVAPLAMGKYDNNAYQSAGGIAQSRKIDWADLPPGPGSGGE